MEVNEETEKRNEFGAGNKKIYSKWRSGTLKMEDEIPQKEGIRSGKRHTCSNYVFSIVKGVSLTINSHEFELPFNPLRQRCTWVFTVRYNDS